MNTIAKALQNRARINRKRPATIVRLDSAARVPQSCANCSGLAAHTRRERSGPHGLLIPYCSTCWRDLSAVGTRQIAATIASALAVVTLLLTLPWLLPSATLFEFAALVAVGGSAPLLFASFVVPPARDGQACAGRAAFWSAPGKLLCFNASWAEKLASGSEQPRREATLQHAREPSLNPWAWTTVVLGLLLTPSLYSLNYPRLVVLNFGPSVVDLAIDGRQVGRVEPTSLESRSAGFRLRVSAGEHVVTIRTPEQEKVDQRSITLSAGRMHLMAIEDQGYCFWLETDHYGRGAPKRRKHRLLSPSRGFWLLPERVDSWFGPNPTSSGDERSSGGAMVALRHAPCEEVPAAVRPADER